MSPVRHLLRDDDRTPAELVDALDLADAVTKDRFSLRPLERPRTAAPLLEWS
jgi:hypothetical protein